MAFSNSLTTTTTPALAFPTSTTNPFLEVQTTASSTTVQLSSTAIPKTSSSATTPTSAPSTGSISSVPTMLSPVGNASPPPLPSSTSSSLSSGNIKLIAASSIVGGLVLISFLIFVFWRLWKGQDIVDILKLRRRPSPQIDDNAHVSLGGVAGVSIQKTQRFSVRSFRYPSRLSIHSTRSRRDTTYSKSARSPRLPPDSPYKQYTEQYLIRPPTAKRPSVPKEKIEPVPKITYKPSPSDSKVMDSFLLNASTETGLHKPEMAQLKQPAVPRKPVHGRLELLDASNAAIRDSQPKRSTSKKLQRKSSRVKVDDRTSWLEKQTPLTPKLELENSMFDEPLSSRLKFDKIDEDYSPLPTPTPSATNASSRRHSPPPEPVKRHSRIPSLTQMVRRMSKQERVHDEELALTDTKR